MSCNEFSFSKAFFIIRAKRNILLLKINVAHSINIGIVSFYDEELTFLRGERASRSSQLVVCCREETELQAEAPALCLQRSCCCSRLRRWTRCSSAPTLARLLCSKSFQTDFCSWRILIFFSIFYAFFILPGVLVFFTASACPRLGSGIIYCLLHFVVENTEVLQVYPDMNFIYIVVVFFFFFLERNCFSGKESSS